MDQITLIEPQKKYADDIWEFRQEILECDVENEDQFAGCISLVVLGMKPVKKQYLQMVGFMKR